MIRFQSVVLVLLATVTLANRSAAQERRPVVADPATSNSHSPEEPMSIFNDKLRRFRFELEEMLVTADTAQEFTVLHQARNKPAIIGAYADAETNSLVVIGPPDAEQPVRETLAQWMVDRQGVSPPPLPAQMRALEFRRQELLREMAVFEVQLVGAEEDKAGKLRERLRAFEDELGVVERQIQVVDRYVQRLHKKNASPAAQAGVVAAGGSHVVK